MKVENLTTADKARVKSKIYYYRGAIISKDDSAGRRITVDKARLPCSSNSKKPRKKAIR